MESVSEKKREFRFNEQGFKEILANINRCYENWITSYNKTHEYDVKIDFTPCCNDKEIELLKKAINIILRNTPDIYEKNGKTINYIAMRRVYTAVILYYYQVVVLEYYYNLSPSFVNDCYTDIIGNDNKIRELIDTISTEDAPYISRVRRILLGFDDLKKFDSSAKGGKYNKTKQRTNQRTKQRTKQRTRKISKKQ